MKRNLFFSLFILLPFITIAQSKIVLPMKNGFIRYEQNKQLADGLGKEELFARALRWMKNSVPQSSFNVVTENTGEIDGNGIFKIVTNAKGSYYLIKVTLHIIVSDHQYTVSISDLYEKPVEQGISNEYSKIGYRWWDYRQGKPWRPEDQLLFTQIDSNITGLLASLQKQMSLLLATPKFKVLALYTTTVESDHVDFAKDAILFYRKMAAKDGFVFDTTTNWKNLNDSNLKNYQVLIWLNDFPQDEAQRQSFQQYMENGGAWLGFHVAGYNDQYTKWPWFVNFFGGAVFYNNNWPPLPAKLIVDDNKHPATRHLPSSYTSTLNEWYGWKPSPRENKNIKVLVTLDPSIYPLGKKDVIRSGDIPVVWTNQKYKMLYMNMGHGDQIFKSDLQNKLFEDAVIWLGIKK